MNKTLYPRGVDSARVIQVIETKSARGSGATEQPARIVTEYWSLDGEKLAESDPYLGGNSLRCFKSEFVPSDSGMERGGIKRNRNRQPNANTGGNETE